MSDWIEICSIEEIPQRAGRVIKTNQGCVAIFRTGNDQVFAIDDACPHKKGPLSEGIVHANSVTCPLHNWVIDLETGKANGADEGSVNTYEIVVRDSRIYRLCGNGLEQLTHDHRTIISSNENYLGRAIGMSQKWRQIIVKQMWYQGNILYLQQMVSMSLPTVSLFLRPSQNTLMIWTTQRN